MDESQYLQLIDTTFRKIQDAFETVEPDDADVYMSGDVLNIAFKNGIRCVVNTQRSVKQVWLAARARAWHFSLDPSTGKWMDDKGLGEELFARLKLIVKEESGVDVSW